MEAGETFIAQITEDGNVLIHITEGSKTPLARCYDKRNEEFKIMVKIDLLTFYPIAFRDKDQEDHVLPSYKFVIEAMEACAKHTPALWEAYFALSNSPLDLEDED